jgi:exonuclease SbcC
MKKSWGDRVKQIKKIIIDNFQCHDYTVIKPAGNGLTVITGPTDYGKSAVVRALRWLFYNRPQGDDFIRHGQTECIVTVVLENDLAVMRRRTSSLNQYWICEGDYEEVYEGFGNNVPLQVQQVLGVYSYDVAGETLNLNIARQLSGPFLGSSITAPTRAKILGKLAGTEVIDKANKELGTDIYRSGQKQKSLEEDIEKYNLKIEKYSWVKPLGETLKNVKNKMQEIKSNKEKLEKLKEIKAALEVNDHKKGLLELALDKLIQLKPAVKMLDKTETDIQYLLDYRSIKERLDELNEKKSKLNYSIEDLEHTAEAQDRLKSIFEDKGKHSKLFNRRHESKLLNELKKNHEFKLRELIQVKESSQLIQSILDKRNKIQSLEEIHYNLYDLSGKKAVIYGNYNKVASADIANEKVIKIANNKSELQDLKDKLNKLNEFEKVITKKNHMIDESIKKAEIYREMYTDKLKEEGICQRCGSEIEEENIKKVI